TTADASPTPIDDQIQFADPAAPCMIELGSGATLVGFSLLSSGGNPAANGICCSAGNPRLSSLLIVGSTASPPQLPDGGWALPSGLSITGSCAPSLDGVTVQGFLGSGIFVQTDALSPVTIDGGQVTKNGSALNGCADPGIELAAGTVDMAGTSVDHNAGTGMSVEPGASLDVSQSSFSQNAQGCYNYYCGLGCRGTITATDVTANGNVGVAFGICGLNGGTFTGTNITTSQNAYIGFMAASNTTVHGLTASQNNRVGVYVEPGASLYVDGLVSIANTNEGLAISSVGASLIVDGGTISDNGSQGTYAGLSLLGGISTIQNVSVTGSTGPGVFISGPATLSGCAVTGNQGVGVLVDADGGVVSSLTLESLDVHGNGIGGSGGAQQGGIFFASPVSVLDFTGNRIHDNQGDQLTLAAGASWGLGSAGDCAAPNAVYCPAAGKVGLRIGAPVTNVVAQGFSWSNDPPVSSIDYEFSVPSTAVDASQPCAASSCP
ncbi:MAG: right-handed parallel beta-helix repeat-containing protein, partial [Deltaproteobacteria bacterium]